jgi:hypothetical protein
MSSVVLGLGGLVIGGLVAAFGYRLFYVALAAFTFIAGFLAGGQVIHAWLGDGLFATVLGWGAGGATGILLAVLALAWFWIGVVVAVAAVAAGATEAVLHAVGFGDGMVAIGLSLAVGIAVGVAAVRLDAPTLLIAVVCAFGGTAFAFIGLFLLTGAIAPDDLADGPFSPFATRPLAFVAWGLISVAATGWQAWNARRSGLGPRLGRGARPRADEAPAADTAATA